MLVTLTNADKLTVEAKVNPQDIDKVQFGQSAALQFYTVDDHARNFWQCDSDFSGHLNGPTHPQSYYTIRIAMPPEQVARLGDVKLVPGMPVEAFVKTGDRTVMSYLMKPLADQINRAFRE